jgi:hypothetical protein
VARKDSRDRKEILEMSVPRARMELLGPREIVVRKAETGRKEFKAIRAMSEPKETLVPRERMAELDPRDSRETLEVRKGLRVLWERMAFPARRDSKATRETLVTPGHKVIRVTLDPRVMMVLLETLVLRELMVPRGTKATTEH